MRFASKERCAMRLSRTILLVMVGCVIGLASVDMAMAQQASGSPEQQLAEKYAPIAELRQQEEACDRDGEGYFPAPVEVVLGNPEVALKQATGEDSKSDTVVKMGPTAQDLAGKDDTYYLDFPGDPHHAKCTYETDFKRFATELSLKPTTYAHIVFDQAHGQLVLQYWFYYYFNDWNNTHESDWEMMQLVFDATSAQEALSQDPVKVGYAQHGGGEISTWDDTKFGRDGVHPIAHPSAGSHGTYYGEEHYIGWGEEGTGFGCDTTNTPVNTVPLIPILVPDNPDPNSQFAWLLFNGRWGERQKSEWNGPKSPNLGKKWTDPIGAMENWRTSSLKIPAADTAGPSATGLFCGLTKAGSRLVTRLGENPKVLVATFLAVIGGIIALFVLKRHALGEAFGIYFKHFGTFLGIGVFTIPIGIAFNGLAILVIENPPMEWVIKWFNDTAAARLTAAALVGAVQQLAMVLLIAPPTIWAIKDLQHGRRPEIRRSFGEAYRRLWPLAAGLVIVGVVTGVLTFLIIGIPIAIWLLVRWWFFAQAIILDDTPSGMESIGSSAQAVRGRWWQALSDILVFGIFSFVPGPLVGALLMILGKATVEFANAFSSLLFALTVPITVIGYSLAYLRYQKRLTPVPIVEPASKPTTGAEPTPA
jgi:hypothetical protein